MVKDYLALLLCCAVVAQAWNTEMLDSGAESLSDLGAGPKEIGDLTLNLGEGVQAKAKESTSATVKIWDKSFSKSSVSMAQAKLGEVVERLGRRHPELLGEAAT